MKKSKAKSKMGHGGARTGAGRPRRWKHRPLKMVRLPVVFLEEILEVAQYMDQNEGRLLFSKASEDLIIISGHPSESLSGEELKELAAERKTQKLVTRVMSGDEQVWVSDETFRESEAF
jgi:hypothetical protein